MGLESNPEGNLKQNVRCGDFSGYAQMQGHGGNETEQDEAYKTECIIHPPPCATVFLK